MSDEPLEQDKPGKKLAWGKPMRPGPKMRSAIYELMGKEKLGIPLEYKLVALKWGVKRCSLETLYRRWKKGEERGNTQMVILADPPSGADERKQSIEKDNERMLGLLSKYERLCCDSFERMLVMAEKEFTEGNDQAILCTQLPQLRSELEKIRRHRVVVEKGSFNLLQALQAAAAAHFQNTGEPAIEMEKPVNAIEVPSRGLNAAIATMAREHQNELENILAPETP